MRKKLNKQIDENLDSQIKELTTEELGDLSELTHKAEKKTKKKKNEKNKGEKHDKAKVKEATDKY